MRPVVASRLTVWPGEPVGSRRSRRRFNVGQNHYPLAVQPYLIAGQIPRGRAGHIPSMRIPTRTEKQTVDGPTRWAPSHRLFRIVGGFGLQDRHGAIEVMDDEHGTPVGEQPRLHTADWRKVKHTQPGIHFCTRNQGRHHHTNHEYPRRTAQLSLPQAFRGRSRGTEPPWTEGSQKQGPAEPSPLPPTLLATHHSAAKITRLSCP